MHNNRRGFVIGGAAGLTTLLAPNVAQACLCRRCRRASAQPATTVLPVNTVYCPTWSTLTLPTGPLSPNTSYKFTITGTGLYACFVGIQQGAATFIPTIIDNNNYPPTVEWGSYYYPAVQKGSGSNPDTFSFNASYTVPQGVTPSSPGSLTITVTLSAPFVNCGAGQWSGQSVTYS